MNNNIEIPEGYKVKSTEAVETNGLHELRVLLEPEEKIIDPSVAIKSGIDCDVWNDERIKHVINLAHNNLDEPSSFVKNIRSAWRHCRIRENYIHYWGGGECPLPDGLKVKIYYREGGFCRSASLAYFRWEHTGELGDIIGFEVLGPTLCWKYK